MSALENAEVILVTGGSGFIGQHIIKQLIANAEQLGITEIRSVDLKPFKNTIDIPKSSLLRTFVGDICEPESVNQYFKGVTGVFHCAAFVSLQYPPDYEALQRHNVDGTRSVVELCVQHNIPRLVYTSCASVCMVPFKGSTFAVVINQTESKCETPNYDVQNPNDFEKAFLIPGYSASKLRGEKIVLNSNGAKLSNRKDYLATTAIRPPLTYGEGDNHFMPVVMQYLAKNGNVYPRIAGAGGKHQFAYAANVAWGHICAYKTLKVSQKAINGLPVFVTDESHIFDVSRLIQKFALLGHMPKVRYSFWYVPHFLFFFFAFIVELLVRLLYPFTKYRLSYSLRGLASFTSSVLMFNRLRASIHMDYAPIVEFDTALQRSATWYSRWADENLNKRKSKST